MPLYYIQRTFTVERTFVVEAPTADEALYAVGDWDEIEEITQDILDTRVFPVDEEEEV